MTYPAPAWVVPAMRAGYLARALVYGLIGYLALRAAWLGGYAEGAEEALEGLTRQEFGTPLLWVISGGAFGFAAWGMLAASMDLDCRGSDAKGIFARLDFAATGLLYALIGIFVAHLAYTGYSSGDGDSRERWTAWVLGLPAGGWIVVAIGLGFIAAGIWYGYKAFAEKYKERLRDTPVVERLAPVCKFGWTAYGVVIVILGCFLVWAGWTLDPSHAGGIAEAFAAVRKAVFGRLLLGLLAFGFIAFAVECLVEAAYRIVPARDGAEVATLSTRQRAGVIPVPGPQPRLP